MQIALSGVQHIFNECVAFVEEMPGQPGSKFLKFVMKNGDLYIFPLNEQACKSIGSQLTSGLIIASVPLPTRDGRQ